jgi:hypothetical protein
MSLDEISKPAADSRFARRGVLRAFGAGAATTAIAGAVGVGGSALESAPAQAQTVTDAAIFNFALNFEYLGAEYYLRGLTGQGLSAAQTSGTGTQGTVTGGTQVAFQSSAIAQYVQRLASDENAHVNFLRAVLGSAAIAEPQIDIVNSWTSLALAAGLIVPGQTFNPYSGDVAFLIGAYVLEDVCVTALAGAAALLTVPSDLTAAAGLLGAEGYQAGAIRTLLADLGAGQVTDAIAALRAKLSNVGDQGTAYNGNYYNFTDTDSNALVYRRTPAQVLDIAYGAPGATSGGFFPNGVNGVLV